MKKKLFWAIITLVFGFMFFVGIHQYIGAAIVFVGLVLLDAYLDEKKQLKNVNKASQNIDVNRN